MIPFNTNIIIDERNYGHIYIVFEIMFEKTNDDIYIKLSLDQSKGISWRNQKFINWKINDYKKPIEIINILEQIINSTKPESKINDNRTIFGKIFDKIFKFEIVNTIDNLAIDEENKAVLSSVIYNEKYGKLVILSYKRKGYSVRSLHIPFETILKLHK